MCKFLCNWEECWNTEGAKCAPSLCGEVNAEEKAN